MNPFTWSLLFVSERSEIPLFIIVAASPADVSPLSQLLNGRCVDEPLFTRTHGELGRAVYDRLAGLKTQRSGGASDGELRVSSSLLCTAPPTHIYQPPLFPVDLRCTGMRATHRRLLSSIQMEISRKNHGSSTM